MNYATINDLELYFRELTTEETAKATELLTAISASLRVEADKVGKDLDAMIANDSDLAQVAKSVTVDVAARYLMTPNEGQPLSQFSESALGYTFSGTPLVAGGGLFIKKAELARLGLRRQRFGSIKMGGCE